jgi:hypothetical protein
VVESGASAAVELSAEVVASAVADLEASAPQVVSAAEPEFFALVFATLALEPSDAEVAYSAIADLEASESESLSVADVAEPRAYSDIAVAFAALEPVVVAAAEADSSGRPRFLAFPNVDHYASSSSSVQAVGQEPVHSSTGALANYGFCNILSTPGLHQNRNLEHYHNNPSPGCSNASDTIDLAINATTSHSRSIGPRLRQGPHRHRLYRESLSHPGLPEMRWAVAGKRVLPAPQRVPLEFPAPVREQSLLSASPVIGCSRST